GIAARLQDADNDLRTLQGRIQSTLPAGVDLGALARQTADLLNGVKGKLSDLDEAITKSRTQMGAAASSAQAAQESAERAAKERTLAAAAVDGIRGDIVEQKRSLGYSQKSIETLSEQIADLTAKAKNPSPPDLAPLVRQLDEVKAQIVDIGKR